MLAQRRLQDNEWVWLGSDTSQGFHSSGEFTHSLSHGVFSQRGILAASSRTNLPQGLCAQPAAAEQGAALHCGHGGQMGGWILLRRLSGPTAASLSPRHQLPEHLPKVSADFQKGKHSPLHGTSPLHPGSQRATVPTVPGCSRHWQVPRYHGNAAKVHIFS